jgi:hypothetical protein
MLSMFNVIMIGTMLIITIVAFASYQSSANLRGNLRMSVAFPRQHVNDQEVLDIVNAYKKHNAGFFLITIILMIPVVFIYYTSLILLYLTAWIGFVLICNNNLFCRYNSRLLLLKSRRMWFGEGDFHELDRSKVQRKRHTLLHRFFPTALDKLVKATAEPIYVDKDEFWINGYYYNPFDKRVTVEKRVGIGTTANLATRSGKFTIYGSVAFILVIFTVMFTLFVQMDFITFQMEIGDTSVKIDAPMYGYEFDSSEIQEINLSYTLPEGGMRTNGAATEGYLLGNFRYDEYGKTKMYIYREFPPYIVIRLTDRTVLFNTKSEEETLLLFEDLNHMIGE